MKRTVVIVSLAAVLIGAFVLRPGSPVAASPTDPGPAVVVVDGRGEILGAPDVMRLSLGVTGSGADLTAVLNRVNAQVARVRNQLVKDGAVAKEVQTADVSVYPVQTKAGRRFEVSQSLDAKLRDLSRAGRAISNALGAGGSGVTLSGLSFALEDNVALLDQARDKAFADARAKAERYARLAGGSLGKVRLVNESTMSPPTYFDKGAAMPMAQRATASDVPIYSGTSAVSVTVTVSWALS